MVTDTTRQTARPRLDQLPLTRLLFAFLPIVTDGIVIPAGMTGYQLARMARRISLGLKVLFTTGYAEPDVGTQAGELRAGSMLRKPYRNQMLAATVRAALEA